VGEKREHGDFIKGGRSDHNEWARSEKSGEEMLPRIVIQLTCEGEENLLRGQGGVVNDNQRGIKQNITDSGSGGHESAVRGPGERRQKEKG